MKSNVHEHVELRNEIERVGRELRTPLMTILGDVAGQPPRPTRLSRAIGLDKSLASRLVRAATSESDLELMHIVPSPEGLRILAQLAENLVDPDSLSRLTIATREFQTLLDSTPGGRNAIDAEISEASNAAREKSEQAARQAAFKSMSFLLGQFCETLSTTLFLVPAEDGTSVDGIEIQRRLGLRRIRPSTPLALLSIYHMPEDGCAHDKVVFEPLDGDGEAGLQGYLLPQFSTHPLPEFEVIHEGLVRTLVLAADPAVAAPAKLSSAFRIRRFWQVRPEERMQSIRGYVLHVPCRTLIRDVFVEESLYPGALPRITFALPGPRGSTPLPEEGDKRHYATVNLSVSIEQLPSGPRAFALPGVADHPAVIDHVLDRAGHARTRFRGWRCAIKYPVPMVEMLWWLAHPDAHGT